MNFLPENYTAPKSSGSYMKLQDGENKIRILTFPLLGWEDWLDKKPVRFRYNLKPSKSFDPEKPVKHFWAFVVWNCLEEKIQILQITQATIMKSLEALVKDADWGLPFFYDIKIYKEGKGTETKYRVNPSPKKAVSEHVIKAFHDKRCNLNALFENLDPFGLYDAYTKGIFSESDLAQEKNADGFVSQEQVEELLFIVKGDTDAEKELQRRMSVIKAKTYREIPVEHFNRLLEGIRKLVVDKEMAHA